MVEVPQPACRGGDSYPASREHSRGCCHHLPEPPLSHGYDRGPRMYLFTDLHEALIKPKRDGQTAKTNRCRLGFMENLDETEPTAILQ